MADTVVADKANVKKSVAKEAVLGWVRGLVASFFGIISGALLMYVSPLINNTISPPDPLANFSAKADGLTVTFHNRSVAATVGWWDFGDGSALEPFNPKQEFVPHQYPRPGTYNVKLNVQNLIGEKNERAAPVTVDAKSSTPGPFIESFEVIPLTPNNTAPAVFKVVSRVKDAELALLQYTEYKPAEICRDKMPCTIERIVTIAEPGPHYFRLIAVSGERSEEKVQVQDVTWPELGGSAMVTVKVAYEAIQLHSEERRVPMAIRWNPEDTGGTSKFEKSWTAPQGYKIVSAVLEPKDENAPVTDECLMVSPDKSQVIVTGELTRPTRFWLGHGHPPIWTAVVKLTMEHRSAPTMTKAREVPMQIALPGKTVIPMPNLPNNWHSVKRVMTMELRDGTKTLWSGDRMPTGAVLSIRNRPMRVTAVERGDQIVLDVSELVNAVPVSRPKQK